MKKPPVILFCFAALFVNANTLTAQSIDFTGALSRMESAIASSQEEFTMRDSYYLGRAAAAYILNSYPPFTQNPALTLYLNLICRALAVNSAIPNWYDGYYVIILDTPIINAFATPGGHIFITRGILGIVTSEDMLAAIIAHEMAHIQLWHGIAAVNHFRAVNDLYQEQNRIAQSLASDIQQRIFTASVNEFVQTLFSGGYSQLQEFEADSAALSLLVSSGYNPQSLIELMRVLDSLQGNQLAGLNSTHPLPSQRIANLQTRMQSLNRFADNREARIDRFRRITGQ